MKPAALFLALLLTPAGPLFAAERKPVAGGSVAEALVREMSANSSAAGKARAQAVEKFCPILRARLGAGWARGTKTPATAAATAAALAVASKLRMQVIRV